MKKMCRENGGGLEVFNVSAPNYFPREAPLVDAMTAVHNDLTGEHRAPFIMGGGTNARKHSRAFAFGLGGVDKPETALFAPGHGSTLKTDEGEFGPGAFVWYPEGTVMSHGATDREECVFLYIHDKAGELTCLD